MKEDKYYKCPICNWTGKEYEMKNDWVFNIFGIKLFEFFTCIYICPRCNAWYSSLKGYIEVDSKEEK
jgi:uncharacterized C2H2 Zn-finger protein